MRQDDERKALRSPSYDIVHLALGEYLVYLKNVNSGQFLF